MSTNLCLPDVPSCLTPSKRKWTEEQRATAKAELIVRMSHGEPTTSILESDRDVFPTYGAVLHWRKVDPDFAEAYEQAQKDQAEIWLQMAIDEALTPPWLDSIDLKLQRKVNSGEISALVAQSMGKAAIHANAQFKKTKIETLKWYAGKMHPRRYGSEVGKEDEEGKSSTVSIELVQFER